MGTAPAPLEDRAGFYRDQPRLARADGGIRIDERRMCDRIRARLGLPEHDAARNEREASGARARGA